VSANASLQEMRSCFATLLDCRITRVVRWCGVRCSSGLAARACAAATMPSSSWCAMRALSGRTRYRPRRRCRRHLLARVSKQQ
jgi:hypothetical protein